jgi:hypothetical protein
MFLQEDEDIDVFSDFNQSTTSINPSSSPMNETAVTKPGASDASSLESPTEVWISPIKGKCSAGYDMLLGWGAKRRLCLGIDPVSLRVCPIELALKFH